MGIACTLHTLGSLRPDLYYDEAYRNGVQALRQIAETAEKLFVSESTVKTYLKRVLMKLGLRDRVGAVVFAYEAGLIKPGTTEGIPQRDT